jgi:hypothetical protein
VVPPAIKPEAVAVQQDPKSKTPWLQKIITGTALASVAAAGGLAAWVSAQSMTAIWKSVAHVAGIAATAIPVFAAGIAGMVAVAHIDEMIFRKSGKKLGLFPLKQDHNGKIQGIHERTDQWCFVKWGCVATVGAASMVLVMKLDDGNIYQETQKILLPDKPPEKQPISPPPSGGVRPVSTLLLSALTAERQRIS